MKERLIGAAVLVALAVWLVPWVLDGGAEPEGQSTTLELPLPEEEVTAPLRTHTIHLDTERSAPVGTPVPARQAAPAPAQSNASGSRSQEEAAPTAAHVDGGGSRGAEAAPTASATNEATVGAASPPRSPPAPGAAANAEAAATNEATVGAASPPRSPPASGVAANAEAAATNEATVGAASPPRSPIERAPAPTSTPPTSSAAALEVAAAPTPAVAARGDWAVQLGSFSEEQNARRLVQRVGTFGYKASISNVRSNGRLLYRVRVGPYATRNQAEAAASALSAHSVPAQVVAAN